MNRPNLQQIDALIDTALRTEAERPVPEGFRSRVMQSVQAEAFAPGQVQARRLRFARPALLAVVIGMAGVVIPITAHYGAWTHRSLPGGMGILDYALTWISVSHLWSPVDIRLAIAGAAGVALVLLGAGVVAVRARRVRG